MLLASGSFCHCTTGGIERGFRREACSVSRQPTFPSRLIFRADGVRDCSLSDDGRLFAGLPHGRERTDDEADSLSCAKRRFAFAQNGILQGLHPGLTLGR